MEHEDDDDWEEDESSSDEELLLGNAKVFKPMSFVRPTSLPQEEENLNARQHTPEVVPAALKGFSKMARMYMQKNNFTGRLGKNETGITAPLEALKRKEGAGLGFVQEATSLPGNRAFEEETIKRRKQLEQQKQQAIHKARIELDLANSWRKHPIAELEVDTLENDVYDTCFLDGLEECESAWRERETSALREVQVNTTLDSMRTKQMQEHETDLQRVQHRLQELGRITVLLHKLVEESNTIDVLQHALLEFKALPQQTLEDFELESVPFLLLDQFLFARFSNTNECLEMAQFIQIEFYNPTLLAQVLQTRVFTKLATVISATPVNQLAQVYRPWVKAFPTLFTREYFDDALDVVFISSESLDYMFALLQDWLDVIGPQAMQAEVANRLGERLAQRNDLSLLKQWLDAALLSKQDFALMCECVLQPVVRENGGKLYMHCQYREIALAAEYYVALKSQIPVTCLEDACIGGRLRHIFDYALELLRMAIDNKPLTNVNVGIFNAIEPQPTSFQHAKAMYLLRSTAAKQVADSSVVGSLKNAVESLAMGLGVDFHPKLGLQVEGKQVYVFGPNCLCYFNQGVVYAKLTGGGGEWKPVHINRLVEMSRAVL